MKKITVGKARGLQQLSNTKGIFNICAFDHRRSLKKMMGGGNAANTSYQAMVDFKLDLCEAVGTCTSGVMLDAGYGVTQSIAANVLPGDVGVLVSMESSMQAETVETSDEFMVENDISLVKSTTSSGIKLPFFYRPDLPNVASNELDEIRKTGLDCVDADVALFLTPKNYIVRELERDPWEYARKKPELMITTVKHLTDVPVDVLGIEFPADVNYESNDDRLLEICKQMNDVSTIPWVLLSGGVNFELFCQQLVIACKAGASGFMAGRVIWQEAAVMPPKARASRFRFLESTAVDRLNQLVSIANTYGTPWNSRLEIHNNYLQPNLKVDWEQEINDEEAPERKVTNTSELQEYSL